jgi:hypothetical protein
MNYGKLTFKLVFSKLWESTDLYSIKQSIYNCIDIFKKNYKNLILFFVKINFIRYTYFT